MQEKLHLLLIGIRVLWDWYQYLQYYSNYIILLMCKGFKMMKWKGEFSNEKNL
ncbi:hypothetical protein HMPREF0877_1819 [Weissella paramesenteroides ATCC 33313]|uniref:Uncharacterized protein n=1 Tax=Weissella paramesenteroides ATCC 33313 TaxID=585506 RepID=C5RCV2_WEIPA|nr:hypothetical protein HMPREF0877_1819 [Weissella paramesenteroides ATCC 33313]